MFKLPPPRPLLRLTILATALTTIAACALMPFHPDTSATAPVLPGFGATTLTPSKANDAARRLFAQGVAQAYAFNEYEAVRQFKAALAQDPDCALCAWGVAWQLGPNFNAKERGDLTEAIKHVDYALKHSAGSSPRDQALIESLALRYGHFSEKRNLAPVLAPICSTSGSNDAIPDPLDSAYADRMLTLTRRFPGDADMVSLYAEAEMVATPQGNHDAMTGKPNGRIGEVTDMLEAALIAQPGHVGLNHYMIHAADEVTVAARAEAAADRLGKLAPQSAHLVHMPSHTFVQLGRYADATRVNQSALAVDEARIIELKRQNFSFNKDWRYHNRHVLWYAALMEGRSALALETARAAALSTPGDYEYHEYQRSMPMLTMLRFQRWDELLKEPFPSGKKGVAIVLGEMARGIALAHTGQLAEAKAALARLEPAAAELIKKNVGTKKIPKIIRSFANSSRLQLRAAIALAEKRTDEALALQAEAVSAAVDADDNEPPQLAAGARLALGNMQMQAQRYAAAEQSFRTDLAKHPRSGWALQGISMALLKQGKPVQAINSELEKNWPLADQALRTMY
jgi:hypothetical protein